MKKLIAICLICAFMLVGCGNMSMGVGNYNFRKIHIDTHEGVKCLNVEKWYDSGSGLEVKTTEAGNIFISEGTTYIMIEKVCPFCG